MNILDWKFNFEIYVYVLIVNFNKLGEDWYRKIDKVIERY